LSTGVVYSDSNGLLSAVLGTLNYIPKWTATGLSTTSLLYDNGTVLGIGYTGPYGANVKLAINGNVGIGVTNTVNKLDINGGVAIGSYAGVYGAPANGLLVSGNVGIGRTSPRAELDLGNGTIYAHQLIDTNTPEFYIDPGGDSVLLGSIQIGGTGTAGSFISDSNGQLILRGSAGAGGTATPSVLIGTAGNEKIDAGVIDPPYTINGKKYATYMASMTGMKEETTGIIQTTEKINGVGYRKIIDFNNLEEGSDLWLFSKTTSLRENIDKMVTLLTPSINTRTWYYVDKEHFTITIFSSRPTSISYRFTAPRFDYEQWANTRNSQHSGYVLNDPDMPSLLTVDENGNGQNESPQIVKETNGEYVYDGNIENLELRIKNSEYALKVGEEIIEEMGAFAEVAAARINAGLIETEDMIVNGILVATNITSEKIVSTTAEIGNLIAKNITVREKIISPVVETEDIISTGSAKLSQIETNTISPQDQNLVIDLNKSTDETLQEASGEIASQNEGPLAQLIIKGFEGKTVATIDERGNATFSGSLAAREATISGLLAAQSASVSGTLTASRIESENIKELEGNIASLSDGSIANNETMQQLSNNVNDIQSLLATIRNSSLPNPGYYQNLDGTTIPWNNSAIQQSNNPTIEELTVTDNSNLYNATVSNSLMVGNLYMDNGSILSLSSDLKLSSLATITLFDGSVVIGRDGTITTKGPLIAQAGIRTNEIRAVNEGEDINIQLSNVKSQMTNQIQNSKFKVQNSQQEEVASIDASGSAKFKELSLEKYMDATSSAAVIAAPDNFVRNGIYAPAIETEAQTAGVGILPTNSSEIIIYNEKIKEDSLIYLTPTEQIPNIQLTVVQKTTCLPNETGCKPYFKVSSGVGAHPEIKFNWLIIN